MKQMKRKKERGITLIALVVTIIVLIILAGVSINLLFGNYGVVTKAKEAKNKMEAAQYEEELKMCVLELQADAVTNGTDFSMETIRKNLVEKVKKVENTTDIEFPIKESETKPEGIYKGYEFYIDEKYVVHVGDKKTDQTDKTEPDTIKTKNISAQDIKNDPETYYGLKVTNYISQNGQSDWKIFYSDGDHIFLITGEYVNTDETNRISPLTKMSSSGYDTWWDRGEFDEFQTVDTETLIRFKATEYTLEDKDDYWGAKCVTTLLNDNNWTSYLDEEINGKRKAEKAIGSPTFEMWRDSWNTRYKNSSDQIYNEISSAGYMVGETGQFLELNKKDGYAYKLYFPYYDVEDYSKNYRLSSPAGCDSYSLLNVSPIGAINFGEYYYSDGIRPVVSLNSGTTVDVEITD